MHLKTSDQAILNLGFGNYTCNWGTHVAGLYETEDERDAIVTGFLNRGAIEGDLQLYCSVERNLDIFRSTYIERCPDCGDHLHDSNIFDIRLARDLYYPEGVFSPLAMDKGLDEFYAVSQHQGTRNVRAAAEMTWALEAVPGVEHLMAYESRLNYFIPGKAWISICLYDVNRFSGATIMDVLRTHPWTISGGVITENPFYQNPDQWLSKNAPQFLSDRSN